ncbi:RusA family crossover junction endodeoxyribonuclease [Pseudoalteromonas sp. SG44-1]|uniref:RusA family crossover junction endodeoxyribonuclease n=1 Tax=Pseudoalteromonas sp. SG44-1 TaxID=2760964 RepID=UPI001601569B|nr:RusA family crossover junction endodeoxyribonuclease [Pseudoalteromonas sp. SG44-1]MBB1420135.1 RusA family crossover junction endodeoxyribonuclease [Pseudoalteromonas sp. SG44-1]
MSEITLDYGLGWLEDLREDGEIYLDIDISPVTLQSKNTQRKEELKKAVRSALSRLDYVLTGDVSFHLTWQLHEQKRLETSNSSDLDNILKPLIDSCCGIDCVLVDDNQLDDVHVQWVNYYDYDNDKVIITLNFNPSETIQKAKLVFVEIDKDLYLPITKYESVAERREAFDLLQTQYSARKTEIEKDGYLRATRRKNKMQRVFHKGRLCEYEMLNKNEYFE